jgi:MFS family permease
MLPDAAASRHIDPPSGRFNIGLAIFLQAAISAGDGLALIALANRVYQGTHASWAVAAVFLAITVPITALAPVAGLMLDRLPTRPVLVTAAGVEALVALGLAGLTGVPATLGLAAGFGICAAVLQPGLGAIVPRIVGAVDITRANSYLQAATWGGFAVGPLLAGLLITTAGSEAALAADAALYALGAIGLCVLQLSGRTVTENEAGRRPSLSVQLRAGLSFLRADREAGLLVATVGAMLAFADMAIVAEVVFAEHVLGAGPGGYSLLVAAWTGGMVIGTLGGGRLPERWLVPVVLAGTLAMGAGLVLAGLAAALWQAAAAYGFAGLGSGVQTLAGRSFLNLRAPGPVAGRVFALYSAVLFGATSLGVVVAVVLLPAAGARLVLILAGGGGIVAGLAGWFGFAMLRRGRRLADPARPGRT